MADIDPELVHDLRAMAPGTAMMGVLLVLGSFCTFALMCTSQFYASAVHGDVMPPVGLLLSDARVLLFLPAGMLAIRAATITRSDSDDLHRELLAGLQAHAAFWWVSLFTVLGAILAAVQSGSG